MSSPEPGPLVNDTIVDNLRITNLRINVPLELKFNFFKATMDKIDELQRQLDFLPVHDLRRCKLLDVLAVTRIGLYRETQDIRLADNAIDNYLEALDLQPPDRVGYIGNIANCFFLRFNVTSNEADLEQATKYYREAMNALSPNHTARAVIFNNAATAFSVSFNLFSKLSDLNDLITCLGKVVLHTPPNLDSRLCELGDSLLLRFYALENADDLAEAISCYRAALQSLPPSSLRTTCLNNLARSLLQSYQITGETTEIGDAVEFCKEAVAAQSPSHPDRAASLEDLATALRIRSQLSDGNASDLEASLEHQKEAVALTAPDSPYRAQRLSNLALCVFRKYEKTKVMEELEQSLSLYRETLALQPVDEPNRHVSLNDFATVLGHRFEVLQSRSDLDESVAQLQEAIRLCPPTLPNFRLYCGNLANSLQARFELLKNKRDLNDAIEQQTQLLRLLSAGNKNSASCLAQLGDDFHLRFTVADETGDMKDLNRAIESYTEAPSQGQECMDQLVHALDLRFRKSGNAEDLDRIVVLCRAELADSSSSQIRAIRLAVLANHLSSRSALFAESSDLEEALRSIDEALHINPSTGQTSLWHAACLTMLACALSTRFQNFGQLSDLDRAIQCQREALELYPSESLDPATSHQNLIDLLSFRFERLHRREDIDEAIALGEERINSCPPQLRVDYIVRLSTALRIRFQRYNQTSDIEKAVAWSREAAALNPKFGNELGRSLYLYSDLTGEMRCLDEAISCIRDALDHWTFGEPNYPVVLGQLGQTLAARFDRSGDVEYLEEAILLARNILDGVANLNPKDTRTAYSDLADRLLRRYIHFGQLADLDNALELYRHTHPDDTSSWNNDTDSIGTRMNIAYSLVASFKAFNKVEHLDEGLACYRHALKLCDAEEAARPHCLNNLANALRVRCHELGRPSDIDEAIELLREALTLYQSPHPDRNMCLMNLGTACLSRFIYVNDEQALDEALERLEEATGNTPADEPLQALCKFNLGTASWYKYQLSPNTDQIHYAKALTLLEDATFLPFPSVKTRFEAAMQWSLVLHKYRHPSTLKAYRCSLNLLEQWMIINSEVEAQHRFLATEQSQSVACDGAAAAIDIGDLESAIELLDHGRTVLWSRLQGYRQSLDLLHQKDKHLARCFESLSKELEDHSLRAETQTESVLGPTSRLADERTKIQRILIQQWDEVVSQIRQIDGFTHFLRPKPYSALQQVSSDGPVICLNVSAFRADAIILLHKQAPILVPLPAVTPSNTLELYIQLNTVLRRRNCVAGTASQLVSILRNLWTKIAEPVVNRLRSLGVERHSRIWWCPTSYLCGLPLHAAGSYSKSNPQPGLPDLFVSSYTPTLSALLRARNTVSEVLPRILIVGQAQPDLPAVEEEIQELQKLGPFFHTLGGKDVNRETLVSALEQYPWVHFACHAKQDPSPFQSSFQLNDGQMTLLDLLRSRRPNAQLAFLSACNTATGDWKTPDETLHLSAALQFSGFQSVVGTLWPMADCDGPEVAREFYRHLFKSERPSSRDSAVALSVATKHLRRQGVPLDRWINFVHMGA
ncbi:CHAT domain-containing protein [Favolaschia claudopus]|uniref:CHAT domain-containing protein n=1 Tax=Favolaschia claudopus TaxID=2862362 RepID=A0AAW0B8B0_9AGAR